MELRAAEPPSLLRWFTPTQAHQKTGLPDAQPKTLGSALGVSCWQILERLAVRGLLRRYLLQAPVLILQRLQALHSTRGQAGVSGLPVVAGGFAYAIFAGGDRPRWPPLSLPGSTCIVRSLACLLRNMTSPTVSIDSTGRLQRLAAQFVGGTSSPGGIRIPSHMAP